MAKTTVRIGKFEYTAVVANWVVVSGMGVTHHGAWETREQAEKFESTMWMRGSVHPAHPYLYAEGVGKVVGPMTVSLMDGETVKVVDFGDAARTVRAQVDRRGVGGTEWSEHRAGIVKIGRSAIAHVSYNGRVWLGTTWVAGGSQEIPIGWTPEVGPPSDPVTHAPGFDRSPEACDRRREASVALLRRVAAAREAAKGVR